MEEKKKKTISEYTSHQLFWSLIGWTLLYGLIFCAAGCLLLALFFSIFTV